MSYTMLLADDSATTHRVMELTFAGQDIRVESVADGEQAVERMRTARPDIVLAEVALPRLDGYRLAEHVRSSPELANVPVLLLTGAFDVVDEPRVRAAGAAGIIVKPFEPETVIKRVKDLLGMSSKRDAAAERPIASPGEPGEHATDDWLPSEGMPSAPDAVTGAASAAPDAASGWAAWREEREHARNGPPVETSGSNTNGIVEQRGDAFDDLDQQLPESSSGPRSMPPADSGAAMFSSEAAALRPSSAAGSERPVFEIDEEWFGGNLGRATSVRAGSGSASDVAETFHALLAAEQGNTPASQPPLATSEPLVISDESVERIATRVAERLAEGAFVETVRRVVEDIAERLVREEIARIRARVEEQRSGR